MDLDRIELHDAVILQTNLSYPEKTVVIDLEFYPEGENSESRSKAKLSFTGVSQYSDISNFDKLKQHAIAGNVSYWVPANGHGITYIYLARGLISITAKEVKMETVA